MPETTGQGYFPGWPHCNNGWRRPADFDGLFAVLYLIVLSFVRWPWGKPLSIYSPTIKFCAIFYVFDFAKIFSMGGR